MKIAILGAGRVGGTLGAGWADAGHDVVFGVRTPDDVLYELNVENPPKLIVDPREEAVVIDRVECAGS